MQYENFACNVLPLPDKSVLKTLHKAIVDSKLKPQSITCAFRHIKGNIQIELSDMVGDTPINGIVSNRKSSLLKNVAIAITGSASCVYENNMSPGNSNAAPKVTFNFNAIGEDASENWKLKLSLFILNVFQP